MTVDLVIRGGTLLTPRGRMAGGLAVDGAITPFEGVKTRGRPVCTIVRGPVVMREGELVGEPGWGRPVVPARAVTVA